jgi:hypothetical protein
MRRPAFALAAFLASATALAQTPPPQPQAGALAAEDGPAQEISPDLPFFPSNQVLRAPPAPRPRPVRTPIFAPTLRIGRLWLPAVASSAPVVEVSAYAGGSLIGGTLGYANVGGGHGISGGVTLFRYASGVVLAEIDGFRISVLPPTLELRLLAIPDSTSPLSATIGGSSDVVGVRVARCLNKTMGLVMTLRAPTLGGGLASAGMSLGYVTIGGSLDVGIVL